MVVRSMLCDGLAVGSYGGQIDAVRHSLRVGYGISGGGCGRTDARACRPVADNAEIRQGQTWEAAADWFGHTMVGPSRVRTVGAYMRLHEIELRLQRETYIFQG